MTDLYTREFADEIPALAGLTPEQRRTVIETGRRVYAQVRAQELDGKSFQSDDEIRKWGEVNEIGPDEMNAALSYLSDSGQLHSVARTPAPVAETVSVRQTPLDEMSDEQIRKVAAEKGIEGEEDLTVRQLKNRIRKIEAGGANGSDSDT